MLRRVCTTLVLTVALLTAGLTVPPAGAAAPDLPETVTRRLGGLPTGSSASLSRPVQTPIPFSMVGFEMPAGASVEYRTSVDGRRWSRWTRVEAEDAEPDPGTAEARGGQVRMSEPVWVGEARHVQTRVKGRGAAARTDRAAIHLIDSAGLGRSAAQRLTDRLKAAWRGTPPQAAAIARKPAIVSRAQWGANERLRKGTPSYAKSVRASIVHHTAGSNSYSKAQAPAVVRGVYAYHTQSQGWSDVGYNILVDRYGTIYEGRAGGVGRAVIGAHAGGFNTGTVGVSLMGEHTRTPPTTAAYRSLARVLAWKADIHRFDPMGSIKYTTAGSSRWRAGTTITMRTIAGHRDVSATACPGNTVYNRLPNLRSDVVSLQGPAFLWPAVRPRAVQTVNGVPLNGPFVFTARVRPAGTWTLRIRNKAGTVVRTVSGSGRRVRATWNPKNRTRGTYQWELTSRGRRTVKGTVRVTAPAITVSARPTSVTRSLAGTLSRPVSFQAGLYPGANWTLSIAPPSGLLRRTASGTGATASHTWAGPALEAGTYRWRFVADDLPARSGTIRVSDDRLDRAGDSTDVSQAAAQLSGLTFPAARRASTAVVTSSDRPLLGLVAAPLAGKDGPVLFTTPAGVPSATLTELRRVLAPGATVYVLGDEALVPGAVAGLSDRGWNVQRVAGNTAIRVAAAASDLLAGSSRGRAIVVDGDGAGAWRTGVAAAAYGARERIPVLLTGTASLAPATASALARNGFTTTLVVGDESAVSADVLAALPGPVRHGGAGPEATAVAVAQGAWERTAARAGDDWTVVNVGPEDGWTRAVAAAPRAALHRSPTLLTGSGRVATATAAYLAGLGYGPGTLGGGLVLGPVSQLSVGTEDALSALLQ